MSAEPLASLDRSTLRERALEALRSAITTGQYRPGDHLSEVALAQHLGVSRGTVREALRHLQQEGLVTAGARGMLRVSTVTPREIRELFRVRAALEGLAAAEIIASPGRDAAVATLRRALDRLVDDGDFAEQLEADLEFHALMIEASANPIARHFYAQLSGRQQRLRNVWLRIDPDNLAAAHADHEQLAAHLIGGDRSAFTSVLAAHFDKYQGAL